MSFCLSTYSDHDAKLLRPADHIIHHQAGGSEKCSRFNFLCSRPPTLRQQQQEEEERINAGPEVSTFPDAGLEVSTFPDAGLEVSTFPDKLKYNTYGGLAGTGWTG